MATVKGTGYGGIIIQINVMKKNLKSSAGIQLYSHCYQHSYKNMVLLGATDRVSRMVFYLCKHLTFWFPITAVILCTLIEIDSGGL